jgi:hypothetical protein
MIKKPLNLKATEKVEKIFFTPQELGAKSPEEVQSIVLANQLNAEISKAQSLGTLVKIMSEFLDEFKNVSADVETIKDLIGMDVQKNHDVPPDDMPGFDVGAKDE